MSKVPKLMSETPSFAGKRGNPIGATESLTVNPQSVDSRQGAPVDPMVHMCRYAK